MDDDLHITVSLADLDPDDFAEVLAMFPQPDESRVGLEREGWDLPPEAA
jgi:hypothetical protein